MRPDEIENYMALNGVEKYDPDVCARGLMNIPGLKVTLLDPEGLPIVCGGYNQVIKGAYCMWMIGTLDGWKKHLLSITRAVKWMNDELIAGGARRLELESITSRTKAIEWYGKAAGFYCEGIRKKLGFGGQDVGIYARIAP